MEQSILDQTIEAESGLNELEQAKSLFTDLNNIEPAKWIIEGIVMEQGLSILFGDKGKGKTTLSLQAVDALMEDASLLSLEVNPVPVLFIEQDEAPRIFRNHRDRVVDELPSLRGLLIPLLYIYWDEEKKDFVDLLKLIRAKKLIEDSDKLLVIIDSFTSLGIPDLNHPKTSEVLDKLRFIAATEDVSFLILHHLNRRGEILGSVTIQIKADNLIELNDQGLKFHKVRGELKNVEEDKLPITKRKNSILFQFPMVRRAKILRQRFDREEAINILMEEYHTSRASARDAYNK